MKNILKKRLYNIQPYRPGKPIDEVKRELGLKNVIKLASNESPYPPPPGVLKAIEKEARNINRYPDGGCYYLRQALSRKLKVAEDQLIFGNGSDEIIVLTLRAVVSEGDEVIMARPTFLIYSIASQILGARLRQIPLKNMRYDLEGMLAAITLKTKIIFIANPDNPAGTYIPAADLTQFLKKIRKDILVFLDEAYYEYAVFSKDYPDGLNLLKKFKNVIVTRTFSKMYGLAGLRIGYAIAQKEIVSILNRIREPFNVNSLAQAAALACLRNQKYYKKLAKEGEGQRHYLYRQLDGLGVGYIRTATNFILIDVKNTRSAIADSLLKQGVIVRDMKSWGLDQYIRVTIGRFEENKKFLNAFRKAMALS